MNQETITGTLIAKTTRAQRLWVDIYQDGKYAFGIAKEDCRLRHEGE